MTTKVNLKINQGATFRHPAQWLNKTTNQPVNLTNFSFRMQARSKVSSPNVLLDLTTENGGIVKTNSELGLFELFIHSDDTTTITWLSAVYDLEAVAVTGEIVRLIEGKISVSPEITR